MSTFQHIQDVFWKKLAAFLNEANSFLPIYKTEKEFLNDYDKETAELMNDLKLIWVTIHPTIETLGEINANLRQNNLFSKDKVVVFISDYVDIQDTQSIVLDERCTNETIILNFRKIDFCNSQYMSLCYVLLFPTNIQDWKI